MTTRETGNKPLTANNIEQYFDAVYVLSFSFDLERRKKIKSQLDRLGIRFTFIDAVNGLEGNAFEVYLSVMNRPLGHLKRFAKENDREAKRGKSFVESAGAIGYIFSYVKILNKAKEDGHTKILTLEDDVILAKNFHVKLSEFMDRIPQSWKAIQLGASQYGWDSVNLEEALENGFYQPRIIDTCGSFALALDAQVADDLIDAAMSFESPFDLLPMGEVYEKYLGECFVCFPGIIMPDVSKSYIRGGRNQFDQAKRMRWDLGNFEFPLRKPLVALLVQNPGKLPQRVLKSLDDRLPINVLTYVNTVEGLRPIHSEECLARYAHKMQKFPDEMTLPYADFCLRLAPRASLGYEELLHALLCEETLSRSAKLTRWPFTNSGRVKGRVSVVVSTYKRMDNLLVAIDSVLSQKNADFELLIVDDNGTPSPYSEEVQAYLANAVASSAASRVEYIVHNENLNGAAARNTGIMASTGEYVCFLDDDDQYLPGRLSEIVAALQGDKKSFGGVYCGFLGWNSPENNLDRYPEEDLAKKLISLDYKQHYLHTNTVTYRFAELIKTNGFDESYPRHQDLEFNLRFLSVSSLGAVMKPLVRLNPRSSSQDNRIFGFRLFGIKQKFLAEFAELIASFGPSAANKIYRAHCEEVIRYNSNNDELPLQIVESEADNFALKTFALLNKPADFERISERTEQNEKIHELDRQIRSLEAELDYKKLELEDCRKSLSYRAVALWRSITKNRFL